MENFTYESKTKLLFGKDTEMAVGKEVKKYSKKILLHYGKNHIKKTGLYDKIIKSLNDSQIEVIELSGVVPNPRIELVYEGIKLCKENDIGLILAVGGGSVIDSAKAIAAGVYYDGDVWDLFTKGIFFEKALPIATILTLPAAGSETSPSSVVSKGNRKKFIRHNVLRPVFSILSPELTLSLPINQTVAGIADMMAHLFERYFTNTKNVMLTDELIESTLRTIIKNAKLILKDPNDYASRSEIMLSGMIAHNGILGVGREEDWATHMIEHELSAFYDVTHGAGLSVMFPAWMKYVYKNDVKRFIRFANKVWNIEGDDEEVALKGIDATKNFFKEIGLPVTLKELDIDSEKFDEMASLCTPIGNFVNLIKEDVVKIYESALE